MVLLFKPIVDDSCELRGSNFFHVYFDYLCGATLIGSRRADQVGLANFLMLSDPTFEYFVHSGVPSIHLQTNVSKLLTAIPDSEQGVKKRGHLSLEAPIDPH